jgi:ubiquitin C-terminal hydrolase
MLPQPIGLPNNGNTCWLNALSQLLMSLGPFNKILSEAKYGKKSIIPIYLAVFGGNIAKFRDLFVVFGARINQQQCADEALTLFIDALQLAPATGMMRIVRKADMYCPSGYNNTATDPLYRLMIYPPAIENMQDFMSRIHGCSVPLAGYNCEKCQAPITSRFERIARVENIIIITFQQYTGKINHYFPYEFTLPNTGGRPPHVFRLVAQIEHAGSTEGGHYWARVQRKDGVYLINDTQVSPSQFQPTAETYMIAYCRLQ